MGNEEKFALLKRYTNPFVNFKTPRESTSSDWDYWNYDKQYSIRFMFNSTCLFNLGECYLSFHSNCSNILLN